MITAIQPAINRIPFGDSKNNTSQKAVDKNPISKTGERFTMLHATALTGLGVGGRLLYEILIDGDFLGEDIYKAGKKIVDKNNKNLTGNKKQLMYLGAFGALLLGFVAAISIVYSALNAPKIMYKGKVNAFVKGKDMDLYMKSNEVEVELYNQMNDKAKDATPEEKKVLAQQYLKLKAAKNQVPDSVKH